MMENLVIAKAREEVVSFLALLWQRKGELSQAELANPQETRPQSWDPLVVSHPRSPSCFILGEPLHPL